MSYREYIENLPESEKTDRILKLGYLVNKIKNPVIDDQTVHFWNLQLQFMEMSETSLYRLYQSLNYDLLYTKNHKTKTIEWIIYNFAENYEMTEDDRLCLATHLALQLSGLA